MTNLTKTQESLARFLKEHPNASIPDIMAEFGFASRTAVYWHIRRLATLGILEIPRVEKRWVVKEDGPWKVIHDCGEAGDK